MKRALLVALLLLMASPARAEQGMMIARAEQGMMIARAEQGMMIARAAEAPGTVALFFFPGDLAGDDRETLRVALSGRGFAVFPISKRSGLKAAEEVVTQTKGLMAAGIPPRHITLLGRGSGGIQALQAAARLGQPGLNIVLTAACPREKRAGAAMAKTLAKEIGKLRGRILSLYASSDPAFGSCREQLSKAGLPDTEELELDGGHGLFDRPAPEWIEPLLRWAGLRRFA